MAKKYKFDDIDRTSLVEVRRKLGLNQKDFWVKFGVTQSGGSRYEDGRNIPKPTRALLWDSFPATLVVAPKKKAKKK